MSGKTNALRTVVGAIHDGVSRETTELIEKLIDANISHEGMRELAKLMIRNAEEYYALCVQLGKSPNDPKVAIGFLLRKGKHVLSFTSAMSESELLEVADALAEMALNLPDNLKYARSGPYGALLGIGMIVIDCLEVVYSVRAVQRWWYETFLKECEIVLTPPASRGSAGPALHAH